MASAKPDLHGVFYPNSVAVIGAYSNENTERLRWTGWLQSLGFKGRIYPINPHASQILGLEAFRSVKDVPGSIDYAIIAVPRAAVLPALKECIEKGIPTVHIFTSGFAETGRPEDKALQAEIVRVIANSNTRVIGPNCMGVYCPAGGLGFGGIMVGSEAAREPGSIAALSQSGSGMDSLFIPGILVRGLRFSKVVSMGNCVDLGMEDFLEYVAEDDETKHVFCYIEGIKDGRRFFEAVKRCAARKPVLVLKGGMTAAGARAASSHTAALAGSGQVWETLYKQARVLKVDSFEEAVDQLVALARLSETRGRRVAIVGRGGGPAVASTDTCERAGLSVPLLADETRRKILELLPAEGSCLSNPVEVGITGRGRISEHYYDVLSLVADDPNIDILLIRINLEVPARVVRIGDEQIKEYVDIWSRAARSLPKPLAVVFDRGEYWEPIQLAYRMREACSKAGVASFPSVESATRA
ncbi:MAG TPA: CoA-binding protein, partial [Anaerolineae bacterium]|nr:CoA-binding protein [Anaerolineae bacterium]